MVFCIIILIMKFEKVIHGIKAVIFDLDGTLVDSMGVWKQIDIDFFKQNGMDTVPEDFAKNIAHLSFLEMAQFVIDTYHFQRTPQEIVDTWIQMSIKAYSHDVMTKPGAQKLLKQIKESGIKISLATTNKKELVSPCLKNNGIDQYFDYCLNVNEIKSNKSEPLIYLKLAEKMNSTPNETLVFEDILMGINTAHNAGFKTVAIYDEASKNQQESLKRIADYYIGDFNDITY